MSHLFTQVQRLNNSKLLYEGIVSYLTDAWHSHAFGGTFSSMRHIIQAMLHVC